MRQVTLSQRDLHLHVMSYIISFRFHQNPFRGFGATKVELCPFPLLWLLAFTTACTTVHAVIHCTDKLKCMLCQDTLNGTIDQVLKRLMIVYGTGVYKGFCPLNYISKIPLFLPSRIVFCLSSAFRRSLFLL